jgi:long-chain acyl-CoA synthetase
LEDSGTKALFYDQAFSASLPELASALPENAPLVCVDDGPMADGVLGHDDLIAAHQAIADAGCKDDDLAGIFYTGGTTGRSKGVMLSHRNLLFNGLNSEASIGYGRAPRYLHAAPMFHMADLLNILAVTVKAGQHSFIASFDPAETLNVMTTEKVTLTLLVHEHVLEGPRAVQLKSCGRAVLGCELSILGADNQPLPSGEIGQIAVRGDNVMQGYWNRPETTKEVLYDGWMLTGDAAYMDENGYVYIVDRVKDMIISGGENIYSAEVEQAVYSHPAVLECAVIGVPDDKWGERVHAIIRLRDGSAADEAEILAHCRTQIGGYKCPRSASFTDQPLPLSGAGKILKTELRKPFWEGTSRNVG